MKSHSAGTSIRNLVSEMLRNRVLSVCDLPRIRKCVVWRMSVLWLTGYNIPILLIFILV